ncbi:MAG: NOL1/NOP2/sun family putative RNA methylase [Candidatus Syntropharchaeia archaeon]
MEKKLSETFVNRYSRLTDWEEFKKYLFIPIKKSIRVNTLKTTVPELKEKLEKRGWKLKPIPWCEEGFWIWGKDERLGSLPEHEMGHFYIQEAASMIPPIVLDPKPGEKILDMCASPGGKTTQIAQYMKNKGKLIANDIREDRIAILKRNLLRMGVRNCTVTQMPGQHFKDVKFDKILVDAPCSGTGTMRNWNSVEKWNPEIFRRISYEQKSLLHHAYCVLRRGGILVYSTCSFEPEENESVVDYLLKRHKKTELEEIDLKGIKRSEPILEFEGKTFDSRIERCLRIWHHDNDTSGFFVAKIRKL